MAKTYDPEFARSCLELNTGMGIPEEQTALAIAEKSGKKAEMQTALQALGTGLDYQRSGKSLLDILDEVCNPQLSYTDIVFEPKASYDRENKKLYTFDQSLTRLKSAGHTRHPRPKEVFSLLIANLENKLTAEQKAIADDMVKSYGEWMSAAVERAGDTLTVYTDPEGLVWNGSAYVKQQNFRFDSKRDFSVSGNPSAKHVDLNKFGNDLVEFLYTRKFEQLPQAMREGEKRAQLCLPPDGQIRPAGRGNYYRFDFSSYYNDVMASRGVVPSAQKKK